MRSSIGLLIPLVLSTTPSLAEETAPATSAAPPPNAPIVLSPGVPVEKPKSRATAPSEETPTERRWFGWQTLTADIAIVGSTAMLLRATDTSVHLPIFIGGTALFLSVSPLLHVAHKSGRAGHSVLFRAISVGVGVPAGALIIAGFAGCTKATPCKLDLVDFAAIGTGVGAMVAAVIDGGVYAFKDVSIVPTAARVPGGMIVGVNAVF